MGPHNPLEFLRAQPFVPFRLHTRKGKSYDIHHPDEALVLLTRVVVPASEKQEAFPDRLEHIAREHVVRLEELPSNASAK